MYRLSGRAEQIREMFGTIAPRYDLLNRLLSLGIDRSWRKTAVELMKIGDGGTALDVATGTGDVALVIAGRYPSCCVVGVDFCPEMIVLGKEKVRAAGLEDRVRLEIAPCEDIPYPDDTFDSAVIAFGIRNVVDRTAGMSEICRVIKPGGRLIVLEPSTPRSSLLRALYGIYFTKILPTVGALLSDRKAYRYLPDSVLSFPPREEFVALMRESGFSRAWHQDLTFGIATLFIGEK